MNERSVRPLMHALSVLCRVAVQEVRRCWLHNADRNETAARSLTISKDDNEYLREAATMQPQWLVIIP